MSVVARLTSFAVALAAVFGLAFWVGGMSDVDVDVEDDHAGMPNDEHGDHGDGSGTAKPAAGYRLALQDKHVGAGRQELAFTVRHRGRPVTAYDVRHEQELHLVVVSKDLTSYQHVHPERDAAGVWRVAVELAPGGYRLYADTQPTGAEPMVIEHNLKVPGLAGPGGPRGPRTAEWTTDRVAGYAVSLTPGDGGVLVSVSRAGEPVTDLEPYLGAYGHLVVIREGSLDYLHAHPEEGPAGPDVAFGVEFAKPGPHRLFFDFSHDGEVHTADFRLVSGQGANGHGH